MVPTASSSSYENDSKNPPDFDDNDWYEESVSDPFNMSELNRESEKRNIKFHTIGYRDGLIAGKEASAQEGFNVGFKESVVVGYKFGLVRGVTSTLSGLPKHVKDKLSGSTESITKLDSLHQTIQLISTNSALKIFHDSILLNDTHSKNSLSTQVRSDDHTSNDNFESFSQDLESLLQEFPSIQLRSDV
ncbi:hypothetical protein ZOSMA_75G00750 [Zostera marina]|uniref:Essential protein Yae1 N-terminal domain-containing protein n=1 Tax=Zostera marina TaxID=29655 RepID=A0A0K9NPX0_ZOSMR|nr:hypothetical protein ZOSMA_75G00750 [Zostera marina]